MMRLICAITLPSIICAVSATSKSSIIDDLITGDNYSTTITLAYARAVRAAGDAMLDTCFFFMISDYIMADGSLANVLAKMQAGYSGVVAGNFQVVEESAQESFFKTFDSGRPQMVVHAAQVDALGIGSSASDDAGQHGQFSALPQRPFEPAVLARR